MADDLLKRSPALLNPRGSLMQPSPSWRTSLFASEASTVNWSFAPGPPVATHYTEAALDVQTFLPPLDPEPPPPVPRFKRPISRRHSLSSPPPMEMVMVETPDVASAGEMPLEEGETVANRKTRRKVVRTKQQPRARRERSASRSQPVRRPAGDSRRTRASDAVEEAGPDEPRAPKRRDEPSAAPPSPQAPRAREERARGAEPSTRGEAAVRAKQGPEKAGTARREDERRTADRVASTDRGTVEPRGTVTARAEEERRAGSPAERSTGRAGEPRVREPDAPASERESRPAAREANAPRNERTPTERDVLRTPTERAVSERAPAERAVSERTPAERAVSERTPAERAVAERTAAERTVSERAAAEAPQDDVRQLEAREMPNRQRTASWMDDRPPGAALSLREMLEFDEDEPAPAPPWQQRTHRVHDHRRTSLLSMARHGSLGQDLAATDLLYASGPELPDRPQSLFEAPRSASIVTSSVAESVHLAAPDPDAASDTPRPPSLLSRAGRTTPEDDAAPPPKRARRGAVSKPSKRTGTAVASTGVPPSDVAPAPEPAQTESTAPRPAKSKPSKKDRGQKLSLKSIKTRLRKLGPQPQLLKAIASIEDRIDRRRQEANRIEQVTPREAAAPEGPQRPARKRSNAVVERDAAEVERILKDVATAVKAAEVRSSPSSASPEVLEDDAPEAPEAREVTPDAGSSRRVAKAKKQIEALKKHDDPEVRAFAEDAAEALEQATGSGGEQTSPEAKEAVVEQVAAVATSKLMVGGHRLSPSHEAALTADTPTPGGWKRGTLVKARGGEEQVMLPSADDGEDEARVAEKIATLRQGSQKRNGKLSGADRRKEEEQVELLLKTDDGRSLIEEEDRARKKTPDEPLSVPEARARKKELSRIARAKRILGLSTPELQAVVDLEPMLEDVDLREDLVPAYLGVGYDTKGRLRAGGLFQADGGPSATHGPPTLIQGQTEMAQLEQSAAEASEQLVQAGQGEQTAGRGTRSTGGTRGSRGTRGSSGTRGARQGPSGRSRGNPLASTGASWSPLTKVDRFVKKHRRNLSQKAIQSLGGRTPGMPGLGVTPVSSNAEIVHLGAPGDAPAAPPAPERTRPTGRKRSDASATPPAPTRTQQRAAKQQAQDAARAADESSGGKSRKGFSWKAPAALLKQGKQALDRKIAERAENLGQGIRTRQLQRRAEKAKGASGPTQGEVLRARDDVLLAALRSLVEQSPEALDLMRRIQDELADLQHVEELRR